MLDASRTTVFTNRIGGQCMEVQSSDRPRRTTNALLKAANTMVLAASSTNNPVNDARRLTPISWVRDPAIVIWMRHTTEGTPVGGSFCITKSASTPGTLYSYGPWLTTGCTPAKLS